MTNNQIAYLKLQEDSRHNLATERLGSDTLAETVRSNRAKEHETNRSNLANESETNRSNVVRETETNRHNLATESLDLSKLGETQRHNLESEQLSKLTYQESARHNQAVEMIQRVANETDRLYKEAQTLLRSSELDLAERKEVQRISESLRDFNETVRYHDLQALTSKGLTSLVQTLAGGLGAVGIGYGLGSGYGNDKLIGLPGPTTTPLQKFVTGLKTLGKNVVLIPETMIDLINDRTIKPNGNRPMGGNEA